VRSDTDRPVVGLKFCAGCRQSVNSAVFTPQLPRSPSMKHSPTSARVFLVAIAVVQATLLAACGWTVREPAPGPQAVTAHPAPDRDAYASRSGLFSDEYADAHLALRNKAVEPMAPTF
jgi:hypothetical protein